MSVIAVYNMKGGVGKTTTAVNLSYLSAVAGERTLLWDLDPQGAASFAFRVRPHVAGFGRKSLEDGHALAAAVKQTDHDGLDLLPADFAYRKLDRLLDRLGKHRRVVTAVLESLARDYDTVWLDCPPGVSLLTEGVFAAADVVLVPTIPTVLSLRTLARLITWADRRGSRPRLAAFFNMADRRKRLHRRVCEWAVLHPEVFLTGHIPYASAVEQMAVRRRPLPVFAPRDPASNAFRSIWIELQTRLQPAGQPGVSAPDDRSFLPRAIERFVAGLEAADGTDTVSSEAGAASVLDPDAAGAAVRFVHCFDTDERDLLRRGLGLELRERAGIFLIAATGTEQGDDPGAGAGRTQAQIDGCWARQILSGQLSPLAALERRLGHPAPVLVARVRASVGEQHLRRVGSRVMEPSGGQGRECCESDSSRAMLGARAESGARTTAGP